MRYDEQAAIQFRIEGDSDGHMISPLLLIQFIENAFKHGLEENKSDCFLSITIQVRDGWLFYHSVNSVNLHKYETGGLGHDNVKKRLDILYAGQHELLIHSDKDVMKLMTQFVKSAFVTHFNTSSDYSLKFSFHSLNLFYLAFAVSNFYAGFPRTKPSCYEKVDRICDFLFLIVHCFAA